MVYFTAPSYGQKAFFDLAVPALSDGQVIVLMPGNYGTLPLAALREAGKDVLVAETDNLPYACAATEPGVVNVRGVKKAVTLAAFPAGDYAAVEAAVDGAFCTGWRKGREMCSPPACPGSIWSCTVRPCWPTPDALRARGGHFEFYYAGMTPAVCRLIEATDRERLAVARAYGLDLVSTAQTFRNQYGVEGETLYDVLQANPAFAGFAPKTLHHRFLTEDTPYSMVPMAALGRLAGVPTPIMDALIALFGELLGEDYAVTGQTAERMGLAGMTPEAIRNLVSA